MRRSRKKRNVRVEMVVKADLDKVSALVDHLVSMVAQLASVVKQAEQACESIRLTQACLAHNTTEQVELIETLIDTLPKSRRPKSLLSRKLAAAEAADAGAQNGAADPDQAEGD